MPLAAPASAMAADPSVRELLVVDDHWPTVQRYALVLAPLGQVVAMNSVEDAIHWLDGGRQPAAIVCEATLPNRGARRLQRHLGANYLPLLQRLVVVSRCSGIRPAGATFATSRPGGLAKLLRTVQHHMSAH